MSNSIFVGENVVPPRIAESRRRVGDAHQFDPLRFHGAWVYLCVAVAAGALLGRSYGVERAMLVGTGFVGGFMFAGAISARSSRRRRQAIIGGALMLLMPVVAWFLGGSNAFFGVLGCAALLSLGALATAHRKGFLATSSVILGTAALALAAPAAALGAGAQGLAAAVLYGLLWPFFCWRTLRVASDLRADRPPGDRPNVRQRGLREAAVAAAWALVAVIVVRCLVS